VILRIVVFAFDKTVITRYGRLMTDLKMLVNSTSGDTPGNAPSGSPGLFSLCFCQYLSSRSPRRYADSPACLQYSTLLAIPRFFPRSSTFHLQLKLAKNGHFLYYFTGAKEKCKKKHRRAPGTTLSPY
jgi:hypothetical protein